MQVYVAVRGCGPKRRFAVTSSPVNCATIKSRPSKVRCGVYFTCDAHAARDFGGGGETRLDELVRIRRLDHSERFDVQGHLCKDPVVSGLFFPLSKKDTCP